MGDLGLIPGLGRSPGEGKDYPLQYSGLENAMDCIVHEVTKSEFHFTRRSTEQRAASYLPAGSDTLAVRPSSCPSSLPQVEGMGREGLLA